MRVVAVAVMFLIPITWGQQTGVEQLFAHAMDQQQRGDFPSAVRDYQQVVKLQPGFFAAWANLGVALVRLNRFDEAIEAYRAALKLDPANAPLRMNLALAYYKKGDLRPATAELETLLKSDASNARTATLLGDCYVRLGDNERAIAILAPIAQTQSSDPDLNYVLGSALIATGKQSDGIALVEKAATLGNSADAWLLAGKTWLKLEDSQRALKDLNEAVRLNPDLPSVYTLRGVAKEGIQDSDAAEEDLRKALVLNPKDFEAAVHLGGILYTRRDLAAAKTYLDRALLLDPASNFALYEMALWKSAAGKPDEAVKDLETVVRRDPKWIQAHIQLAVLYYRVNRQQDGLRERQIVDRLSTEQQKAETGGRVEH